MKSFSAAEAKTQFSRIIGRVENGEEIVITRYGKPVAKIIPVRRRRPRREELEKIAADLDAFRKAHPLDGLTVKQMIEEGRRY